MKLLKQHKFLLIVLVILVTILILKTKFKTKIEHFPPSVSDLVNDVKDKVMSGINSTVNVAKKEVNNIKDQALKDANFIKQQVNNLKGEIDNVASTAENVAKKAIDDTTKTIKDDFNKVTDPLVSIIDKFGDVFKEFGGFFEQVFEPIQGIVNILVATLNFSIRIINKMKKCNMIYIKSVPIRIRFRDTLAKLMEISILSIQFMNPMVFFNPFAFANYLFNINKRLIELSKVMIKNIALDWTDISKLDLKGCFGIDEFYDLGKVYIDEMKNLAGKIELTAENVKKIVEKLGEIIPIKTSSINIDFSLLPFMKIPWSPKELLDSVNESTELKNTVISFISSLTNKSQDKLKKILSDGMSLPKNYDVEKLDKKITAS